MADDASTTTTDTGTTQTAATQAIASGDKTAVPDFLSGFADNTRDYVANKGWKSAVDMLTSYQTLESKFGADKVAIPKEGDVEGEKAFRAKMGVPDAADKYEIKLPEGASVDADFLKTAKGWMHEAGLTPKQAQIVASRWNDHASAILKDGAAAKLRASEDGLNDLVKEWGGKADEHKAASQRAFKAVMKPAGMEAADLDKIEDAIGTAKMMKMFAHFGGMIAEARFIDGGTSAAEQFTPEAARAEIQRLKTDREWFAKFQAGDAQAQARWKALQAAAAAGLAA